MLVPARDPAALASAMQRLWQEPQRTLELGARGRQTASECFSLERQITRTVGLYRTLDAKR